MKLHIIWKVLLINLTVFFSIASAANFYKWTDEYGGVHFSDSIQNIPPQYRDQFQTGRFEPTIQKKSDKIEKDYIKAESPSVKAAEETSDDDGAEPALKEYKVSYDAFEGATRRIIIKVRINDSITVPMALDTGSPDMLIFSDLADRLDLLENNEAKVLFQAGGIGGTVPAVRTIIDNIQIGEMKQEVVPAKIIDGVTDAFDGLIGMDFIVNYSVQIDSKNNMLVFKELPEEKNRPGGRDEHWWRSQYEELTALRDEWEAYWDYLDEMNLSPVNRRMNEEKLERLKEIVEKQVEGTKKLLNKLNAYARKNYVPMHGRKF